MIKKLKNMDGFDIFIVGILSLFGITALLLVVALLAMYELGKYVTEQVYIMMTANDDVEAPSDYVFRAEVSE